MTFSFGIAPTTSTSSEVLPLVALANKSEKYAIQVSNNKFKLSFIQVTQRNEIRKDKVVVYEVNECE